MGEKDRGKRTPLLERHLKALSRLPYGSIYFDRTAAMDFKLMERGSTELADELALLEESLAESAEKLGKASGEAGGVGRILDREPDLKEIFTDLVARILAVLGDPEPEELLGRVPVAVDLHVTPEVSGSLGLLKKGRLDAQNN
jgi:hypothetical protein